MSSITTLFSVLPLQTTSPILDTLLYISLGLAAVSCIVLIVFFSITIKNRSKEPTVPILTKPDILAHQLSKVIVEQAFAGKSKIENVSNPNTLVAELLSINFFLFVILTPRYISNSDTFEAVFTSIYKYVFTNSSVTSLSIPLLRTKSETHINYLLNFSFDKDKNLDVDEMFEAAASLVAHAKESETFDYIDSDFYLASGFSSIMESKLFVISHINDTTEYITNILKKYAV